MSILPLIALAAVVVVEEEGSSRAEKPVSVPRAQAPVIDGRLNAAEWRGSAILKRPEGEVLLRHDGKYLYIGVRGIKRGVPSVCVTRCDVRDTPRSRSLAVRSGLGGSAPVGQPQQAEMRIALDQLDARDPRFSIAFLMVDDDAPERAKLGKVTSTRIRLGRSS
jgi:hypothetical protein